MIRLKTFHFRNLPPFALPSDNFVYVLFAALLLRLCDSRDSHRLFNSMDSGDVRIEDLDATCTTLIMRGLNRQTTREMLQTLLCLGCVDRPWLFDERDEILPII